MFAKLGAFWSVFKAGEAVANPTAWKRGQITVAMLVTLGGAVLSLLHTFGVKFDLSPEQLASIFGGVLTVVGLFNHASTVASTDKVNLLGMAAAGEGDAADARDGKPDVASPADRLAAVLPHVDTADLDGSRPIVSAPAESIADSFDIAHNSGA